MKYINAKSTVRKTIIELAIMPASASRGPNVFEMAAFSVSAALAEAEADVDEGPNGVDADGNKLGVFDSGSEERVACVRDECEVFRIDLNAGAFSWPLMVDISVSTRLHS